MAAGGLTDALAGFVADRPVDLVTPAAAREVRRAVVDLLGVTLAGQRTEAGALATAHAAGQAGAGPAAVLGAGRRLAPTHAAFANGVAGHALDFDDIGLGAGHVSVALVPAALAVAESVDASSRALVEAVAIGYEVAHRLTRVAATDLDGPYAAGFHKPGVYAAFGGVAAAAHLLGLDRAQMRSALGIAASEAGGLRVNFGSMAKPLHAGLANRTAVEAALLARSGFTASDEALEGRYGWFDAFFGAEGDLDRVLDGLGGPLAVEEGLRFKPYPCCGANHHAIEGVLALVGEHDLAAPAIASIEVAVNARYLDEVLVHPWPAASPLEGKFSLAYNVAAAAADRAVTVATFERDAVARLAPLRARITTIADPALSTSEAVVRVATTDGRQLVRHQTTVRGTLDAPFTDADLDDKFRGAATGVLGPAAVEDALAMLASLGDLAGLRPLTEVLLGGHQRIR